VFVQFILVFAIPCRFEEAAKVLTQMSGVEVSSKELLVKGHATYTGNMDSDNSVSPAGEYLLCSVCRRKLTIFLNRQPGTCQAGLHVFFICTFFETIVSDYGYLDGYLVYAKLRQLRYLHMDINIIYRYRLVAEVFCVRCL
jgi:hypothetical protein